ncbi:MAG: long-chain fatty acid--CoA ligase, partial [Bacteroidales bacterium]|nr:long-chain fatty acid--CoA ligase [Bacteroidales bacterium]
MNIKYTIPYQFTKSVEKYWNKPMLAHVSEKPTSYKEAEVLIKSLCSFLTDIGIKKSSKVAILGENSVNWGVTYLAITSMGAVVVPILPGFSDVEIENVLQHSETECLFVSDKQFKKINSENLNSLHSIIDINDFAILKGSRESNFKYGKYCTDRFEVSEDDLAAIIYTSGTTGKSKGVMLSHKKICYNVESSGILQPVFPSDRFLSILPLSHTYENTLGFLLPIFNGASIYYLKQITAPSVIIKALQEVKPTMMLTVPMIIENIYRHRIAPSFRKNKIITRLYSNKRLKLFLHRIAGKKLLKTFGGKIRFFGVGGAK